jgi:hypothetical protein
LSVRAIWKLDAKTVCDELTTALGSDVSSYRTVRRWAQHFREGRENVNDDPRSGRQVSVFTDENIGKSAPSCSVFNGKLLVAMVVVLFSNCWNNFTYSSLDLSWTSIIMPLHRQRTISSSVPRLEFIKQVHFM